MTICSAIVPTVMMTELLKYCITSTFLALRMLSIPSKENVFGQKVTGTLIASA